ncbi:MAG TPA: peptide ABC transporter substrate-binding protein [Candidatus Didemnitutus sp.]|nr:peptide ABC transporter substrate-binding protein [Candidatus Didemnitutus sp.]
MPRHCLVLLLAATGLFSVSCSRRETAVEAGDRTQSLLVGNGAEPQDLDPQVVTVLSDQNIMMALFDGLTALDEQSTKPVPAAAEKWESSADGLAWTFHLRPQLKWSNGEPLTAADFVASWHRALDPKLAAENGWYFYSVRNAEAFNGGKITDFGQVGFAAPDDRTLVITLDHPTPYLPALVSLPAWFPINPRVVARFDGMQKRGTPWTRAGNHVGNGPFMLKEWTPNSRIVTVKNPYHWEAAKTKLEQLTFLPLENPGAEERSFRAGQLHVTFFLPLDKIAAWREHNPEQLRLDPQAQINFLRLNVTRAPLGDVRVRRALSLALDRDTLVRTVLQGSRLAAGSLTPPGTGGYTARARVPVDFVQARQLLVEAGFPGGKGLPEIEMQCRNDEVSPKLAEAIQAIWLKELGVRLTLAPVEQKIWIQNQQHLDYSISLAAWTADFPDPVTYLGLFTGDSAYNWTGWKNADYDHLLDEAAHTLDPVKRFEIFQQAEQLILEQAPVAPVHLGAQTYLIDPAVKGWVPAPLVFRRYQYVYLQSP